MIVFANRVVGKDGPVEFHLGTEIPQPRELVTVERTYEALEDQGNGQQAMACVLSVQEDGTIGWRPKGTSGPFEVAQKVQGFYLYAPGVRLHGDLKLPVYALARFEGYEP